MRILVTGITGQIGSALLQCLQPYDGLLPADRTALDLSRPAGLGARLDELRPDLIVNPAAYTAVDRAEDERELSFVVNAESPGIIARWAAEHRVPMVQFSTDYVFDGHGNMPWNEDDLPAPLGAYGESKLAGEQAVQSAGGSHLIVRTSWVYAAQGVNFLRTIARLAEERKELRVVSDQIGAPTSAPWIAEVISKIIARNSSDLAAEFKRVRHKLNVVAAGQTSWHGFAEAIIDGMKRRKMPTTIQSVIPIETKDYPTKATRPLNSRLSVSRLIDVFEIKPPGWEFLLDRELDRLASLARADWTTG